MPMFVIWDRVFGGMCFVKLNACLFCKKELYKLYMVCKVKTLVNMYLSFNNDITKYIFEIITLCKFK